MFRYTKADPAPGTTGVSRATRLRVWFNQPPDRHTVTGLRVRLYTGRFEVPGTTRVDLVDQKISFKPGEVLRPNVRHLLRVSRDVRGLNGAALEQSLLLDFTTGTRVRTSTLPEPPTPAGSEIQALFKGHCAWCHSGDRAPMGVKLDSMAATQHTAVGRPASVPGRTLVRVGDHARSYLMFKMLDRGGISGLIMPPGGPRLSAANLRRVARWIDAGAKP